MEIAREMLRRRGINTRGMGPDKLSRLALSRGMGAGFHGTSDFPNLVANLAGKVLQKAYEAQPRTFTGWAERADLPDFKPTTVVALGGSPNLLKLNPQAEIKKGTVGEKAETWFLSTYAIRVGFTRQMMVNDDLSALSRIPKGFASSAASLENDLVYGLLTGNVVLGSDSTALFHANHANLTTGAGGALSVAGLQAMTVLAAKQTGIEGRLINVQVKNLIVPAALGVTAKQLTTQITPALVGSVNPFTGEFDRIIVEPRLDVVSATAFYGAANPGSVDTIQYGYLQGEGEGPRVAEMDSWEIDGMEFRCIHDFGTGVIDYRGLYKNNGA